LVNVVAEDRFWQGVAAFNGQQFYQCHDLLEAIWMESTESEKNFYQGILQIAVACYHLGNGNWRGTVILLGEGIRRLADFEPIYQDIDVRQLRQDSYALLEQLQPMSTEQFAKFVQWLSTQDCASPLTESQKTQNQKIENPERVNSFPGLLPKIVKIKA